jgi:SAM-dependent methyltransferase
VVAFVALILFACVVAMATRMNTAMIAQYRSKLVVGGASGGESATTTDDPRDVSTITTINPKSHRPTTHNTKNNIYSHPRDEAQINTIMSKGSHDEMGRLIEVLAKRAPSRAELMKLLSESPDDRTVYEWLSGSVKATGKGIKDTTGKGIKDTTGKGIKDTTGKGIKDANGEDTTSANGNSADIARGRALAHKYHATTRHLLKLPRAPKYLDMGGKEGAITKEFGSLIGARSIDVVEVDEYTVEGIKYHVVESGDNYKLPYRDNEFDIITAFMVLHHVENLLSMISEIQRVLKPGGYFVVADHDCWDAMDAMLIDITHLIYQVGDEGFDPKKDNYYMRYFSMRQLHELMKPLTRRGDGWVESNKPFISADRKFWTVFVKE